MFGLQSDVKDLLLALLNPSTLSQVTTQVIHYDNMVFERRQKMHHEPTLIAQKSFTPLVTPKNFPIAMLI
jgi:hypothetical protein